MTERLLLPVLLRVASHAESATARPLEGESRSSPLNFLQVVTIQKRGTAQIGAYPFSASRQ